MVPDTFHDFFLGSAGAAGAFAGLLFVAISVAPHATLVDTAPFERRAAAAGAFSGLLNAFFVSMIAMLPGTSLGPAASTFGGLGEVATLSFLVELVLKRARLRRLVYEIGLLLVALFLYGVELADGIAFTRAPGETHYVGSIAAVILGLYALSIARAWQLLGGRMRIFRHLPFRRDGGDEPANDTDRPGTDSTGSTDPADGSGRG